MSKTKAQIQTELRSLRAKLACSERNAARQERKEEWKRAELLEQTVGACNEKIKRMHAERDALRIETARLQMYANKNEHTIETLRRMVAGLRAGQDTLERKETAYKASIDELTAQRDTAEAERDEYAGKLTETEHALNEAVKQRDEYAAKLVEKGAAVSFLEGQLVARDAELKSASDLLEARDVRARSAESRADYWETRASDLMRPWWRRTLDGLCSFTSEGGAS